MTDVPCAAHAVRTYRRSLSDRATPPAVDTEEDAVTDSTVTPPDGPHPQGTGIREDAPTLTGLPDDAPDELRATLSGGDLGHIPTDTEDAERTGDAR